MDLNTPTNTDSAQMKAAAKKNLLYPAILFDVIAITYFLVINHAENQTGETKVYWLFAKMYNMTGKIGGTALFFGLGMFMVILFALKMVSIKKQEQQG